MHARMWGGLLQDTVSPLGDMVHFFINLLEKMKYFCGKTKTKTKKPQTNKTKQTNKPYNIYQNRT
jgi:hypothetical protein